MDLGSENANQNTSQNTSQNASQNASQSAVSVNCWIQKQSDQRIWYLFCG